MKNRDSLGEWAETCRQQLSVHLRDSAEPRMGSSVSICSYRARKGVNSHGSHSVRLGSLWVPASHTPRVCSLSALLLALCFSQSVSLANSSSSELLRFSEAPNFPAPLQFTASQWSFSSQNRIFFTSVLHRFTVVRYLLSFLNNFIVFSLYLQKSKYVHI